MTVWMIWAIVVSGLLAVGAAMMERVAASFGGARRFVWVTAAIVAVISPAVSAWRRSSAEGTNSATRALPVGRALGSADIAPGAGMAVWQRMNSFANAAKVADVWILRASLIASSIMLILVVGGTWRMRRRSRGWVAADTEFGRVFVSHDDGPAVVGFVQPVIVIPRWALGLERTERDLMLRHEREHLRAHDSRVLLAAVLVLTLVPWNVALWWILRRLRLAIEIDCDTRVIHAVGQTHAYGTMLLSVGERYATRPSLAASLVEAGAHLEVRITAMMMPPVKNPIRAALPFVVAAVGTIAVAAWLPAPAPAQVVRPMARVGAEPRPLRGNPSPRYPQDLIASGVEGAVLMTFSTDAGGIPDTSTIEVLESSHKSFETAIRTTLPQWRYDSPGHVRLAVRFLGLDTEQREATGSARSPNFVVEGVPVMPVVVVAVLDRLAPRSP